MFKEIIPVYTDNVTRTHKSKMQSYWLLQMLVYAFTSRLQGVNECCVNFFSVNIGSL